MRRVSILLLIGCGGENQLFDASPTPDAPVADAPAADAPMVDAPGIDATEADALETGLWVSDGMGGRMPADHSCNGTRIDPPGANAEFTVDGTVVDFQTLGNVANATVSSSLDDGATVYDSKTADGAGRFTGLRIPANQYRIAFKTVGTGQIETYELGIPVPPTTTMVTRWSVSQFTANALPSFVGLSYDGTQALVVGIVRDCQERRVGGAVATMGTTPDSQVFYFNDVGIPVGRQIQMFTNLDGLVSGMNAPPQTPAAIQVWNATNSQMQIGQVQTPFVAGGFTLVELPPLPP